MLKDLPCILEMYSSDDICKNKPVYMVIPFSFYVKY